jgi:hypothetical protein
MQAKVNYAEKKISTYCFYDEKKFAPEISLSHFSDARLEIINFMVQFSDTLVYRSLLRCGIISKFGSKFYNECG